VEQLTKTYHTNPVLDNINLQVPRGSIFGLVGPNGAGKTTLIKLIMGILLPDQGRVYIDGVDVHQNPGIKSRVGYVSDYQNYYPNFRVQDMIRLYRETYTNWDAQRFAELTQVFKLPEGKKIKHLSKGMRAQLAILLNLSVSPAVLVLDEPTSGLDPVLRRQLLNIFLEEVARNETTIFLSTHNLNELERICDRIGIIHNGRVLFDESLEQMKQQIRKIQVAFAGEPPEGVLEQSTILKVERQGRVYTIVVRENVNQLMAELEKYRPLLLESVDMSLEDIFIYRMGGMGYGCISGTTLGNGILSLIFLFFPMGFPALIAVHLDYWTAQSAWNLIYDSKEIGFLLTVPTYIMDNIVLGHANLPLIYGVLVLLTGILYQLTKYLFARNRLENNGEVLMFEQLEGFFKLGVAVCFALLGGPLVINIFRMQATPSFVLISNVLMGVIFWFLVNWIIKWRKVAN